jgi:hypothetical protein
LPTVIWVLTFTGIALGGLVMVSCYAVWLAHKISDVLSELAVLADRAGQMAELAGEIGVPETPRYSADNSGGRIRRAGSPAEPRT